MCKPQNYVLLLVITVTDETRLQMMSLRTTLAVSAVYLVAELAQALRSLMDPLFDTFSSTLQKLASGTKKLLVAASEAAMTSLLTNCSCIPKMCQMLLSGISEKSPTARSAIATQLPIMIKAHAQQDKAAFEYSGSMELLEKSIRKALSDPTPSVRDKGRMAFWEFYEVWTTDADRIAASLDPQARSQLEKARLKANGPLAKTASSSNLAASNISRPGSSASARPSVRQMIAARKAAAARGDNNGVKEQSKDHGPASSSQHASVLAQKSPKAASPPPSTPGGRSNDTPTKRSVSRPSHGPANVLRGVQDAQKSAQPSSSRLITPASQGRRSPYSPSSSPESTALRRPPVVRRSMADKSINLMAFATPASASVSSSADTRSTSSSDIDSGLAGKMAHHNLLDMSMSSAGVDENSGMALEAMKNQADQAEQTATRLLEIATEEEEGGLTATLPPQGENASFAAHSPEATSALLPPAPLPQGTPTVPFNKSSSHLPQFEDSPMAPPKPRGSLLLGSRAIQDSWWLEKAKRKLLLISKYYSDSPVQTLDRLLL